MFDQISVFLENKKGQLAEVTRIMAENGIDIRALNIAEASDYGVLRVITNDSKKTVSVLSENGFIASETDVCAIALDDHPGSLSEALTILSEHDMDVSYMYSIFSNLSGKCFMIMKLQDAGEAEELFRSLGVHVAEKEDLNLR